MNFLNKIPDWLRWILFLPVSFFAGFAAYPIIKIINQILFFEETEWFLGPILLTALSGGWAGFIFVWVGAKIAPKKQFLVSIILLVFIAVISGISLMSKIVLGPTSSISWGKLLISIGSTLIGAIFACNSFYKETKNVSEDLWQL